MDERLRQLIVLGRQHYVAGDYDKAERYFSQVVRGRCAFADIFNMLGVIYHDQGRFSDAETAFNQALTINPNYTEAALNLSVTYNDRGKYDEARSVYEKAVGHSHEEPRSLDPFAKGKLANMHAEVGDAYAGMGLYAEARLEFEKALSLCPTFIDIRTRLADVLRDADCLDDAVIEYRRVVQEKPSYIPARIALGVALYSQGRHKDATSEWSAVVESTDADPSAIKSAKLYLRMVGDAD